MLAECNKTSVPLAKPDSMQSPVGELLVEMPQDDIFASLRAIQRKLDEGKVRERFSDIAHEEAVRKFHEDYSL